MRTITRWSKPAARGYGSFNNYTESTTHAIAGGSLRVTLCGVFPTVSHRGDYLWSEDREDVTCTRCRLAMMSLAQEPDHA